MTARGKYSDVRYGYGDVKFCALSEDMIVDVYIQIGHKVTLSNDTGVIIYADEGGHNLPIRLSLPHRTVLSSGTPVFLEEDSAWLNRLFPKIGEDYEVRFRLAAGDELLEENIRKNYYVPEENTFYNFFRMPDRDVTVYLTLLHYMQAQADVVSGERSVRIEHMIRANEWVATNKLLEGDTWRVAAYPADGYKVKSVRFNWTKSNLTEDVRKTAFTDAFPQGLVSGIASWIPKTKAGQAAKTMGRNIFVEVEFELGSPAQRTVIWLDGDGSELDRKTYPEGMAEPTTDKTPAKAAENGNVYTFDRWDSGTVEGAMKTYKPTFTFVHTHDWSEWRQTKAPTCMEPGEAERV